MLTGVTGRSLILIHPANNAMKELRGCIAPVSKHTGQGKGSGSRIAFDNLKKVISDALETEAVYLIIKSLDNDNQRKGTKTHPAVFPQT